jgi:hypothetical protein
MRTVRSILLAAVVVVSLALPAAAAEQRRTVTAARSQPAPQMPIERPGRPKAPGSPIHRFLVWVLNELEPPHP